MIKKINEYAFIDREGNKVTRESHDAKRTGKAYGFFDCNASKTEIEGELPAVRIDTRTTKELELSLVEDMNQLRGELNDVDLLSIVRKAKEDGMKYVMKATYPGATNEKTSGELQALLINTSNSLFCQTNEHIRGRVVYKEKGKYIFRE